MPGIKGVTRKGVTRILECTSFGDFFGYKLTTNIYDGMLDHYVHTRKMDFELGDDFEFGDYELGNFELRDLEFGDFEFGDFELGYGDVEFDQMINSCQRS